MKLGPWLSLLPCLPLFGCASESDLKWEASVEETQLIVEALDEDEDGFTTDSGDCNDNDPEVNPGVEEQCNNADDNCDGRVDEGLLYAYYPDGDEDGFGRTDDGEFSCTPLEGFVLVPDDCDDTRPDVYPNATELCDGTDNNCNGVIDEGLDLTLFHDSDQDSYGDSEDVLITCDPPSDYVFIGGDCDDSDATVHPEATEICDTLDNNCNGYIDEGVGIIVYEDLDDDGYGNPDSETSRCEVQNGWVANGDDCDDSSAQVNPAASETCNGVDDNCDDSVDEDFDEDLDGYSPCGDQPDCADDDPEIHPDAEETCDRIDNNCDGLVDSDGYEPNNTYQEAYLLEHVDGFESPDVTVLNANIDTDSDLSDFYRLDLIDSESRQFEFYIAASLTSIPAATNYDLYLWWIDPVNQEAGPIIVAQSARGGNSDELLEHPGENRIDNGGTYYVEVRRTSGQSCAQYYTLRLENGG